MAGLGKQLRGSGIARINKAAGGEVESEDDIDPYFTIKLPDDDKDLDPHFTIKLPDDDKDLDPHFTIKRPKRSDIKKTLGYKKGGKVQKVMHEFKTGALHSGSKKGPVVKSRKQAIAIALSEQRKAKGKK